MAFLFSVIIPTCDRQDQLSQCLDRLANGAQGFSFDSYEVIVTDDGKSSSKQMINERYSWVTWVQGPGKGPAANRNNGAKHARGEWLLFTDDDCLPNSDWIQKYSEAVTENKEVKAFEGAIHPIGNFDKDFAECPVNINGGCFWSANICIDKKLFFSIGGFDVNYRMAALEDNDLYIQVKKKTPVSFVRAAIVFHPVRTADLLGSIKKIKSRGLNWLYYTQKNKRELGYHNDRDIILAGYSSQFRSLIKSIKSFYFKKSIYSFMVILFGMPIVIYTMKFKKQN